MTRTIAIVALIFGALFTSTSPEQGIRIEAQDVSEAMFSDLLAQGYKGTPGDGSEALTVSIADARNAVYTDSDITLIYGKVI